jgi:D-lactate dehydrogenase (cytochrome)
VAATARGAGTGLEGGCIAYSGGVVLDTSLMKTTKLVPGEQLAVVGLYKLNAVHPELESVR